MSYVSRESWVKDYMRLMDDEYGDYGFCDDPVPSYEEFADDWDSSEEIDTGWPSYVGVKSMDIDDDEECAVPRKVTKIREIKVPEGIRKSKRDVWMESLRRLEQAARTTTDFRNLSGWYDYLEDLEKDRARKHEIFRNGDDYPIEYGENENSTLFSGGLGNVISRQMRKGDLLDYLYCKPDTLHELVTTDYMIHFMKAIDKDERELFYYKVLEDLSNKEVAEMSDAKLEQQIRDWEDYYDSIELYHNYDGSQMAEALNGNNELINQTLLTTSEAEINEAERFVNDGIDKVDQAITSAKDSLQSAMESLNDAIESQNQLLEEITNNTSGTDDKGTGGSTGKYKTYAEAKNAAESYAQAGYKDVKIEKTDDGYNVSRGNENWKEQQRNINRYQHITQPRQAVLYQKQGDEQRKNYAQKIIDSYGDFIIASSIEAKSGYPVMFSLDGLLSGKYLYAKSFSNTKDVLNELLKYQLIDGDEIHRYGYTGNNNPTKLMGNWFDELTGNAMYHDYGIEKFATGGLVNYTGPAWVDGSPVLDCWRY